jgi:hypothetical protein
MEKLDGRYAVLDMNIPELKTRKANVTRPTWIPNSRHTLLETNNFFISLFNE